MNSSWLAEAAAEFVSENVNIIVANATGVYVARRTTSTIPIDAATSDQSAACCNFASIGAQGA